MYKNILDKFDLDNLSVHLSKELNIDIEKVRDALDTPEKDTNIDNNNSKVIIYREWLSTKKSSELFSYLKKNVEWGRHL